MNYVLFRFTVKKLQKEEKPEPNEKNPDISGNLTEIELLNSQEMSYMHCKNYCNGAMHSNAQIAENFATIILVYMEIISGASRGGGGLCRICLE